MNSTGSLVRGIWKVPGWLQGLPDLLNKKLATWVMTLSRQPYSTERTRSWPEHPHIPPYPKPRVRDPWPKARAPEAPK